MAIRFFASESGRNLALALAILVAWISLARLRARPIIAQLVGDDWPEGMAQVFATLQCLGPLHLLGYWNRVGTYVYTKVRAELEAREWSYFSARINAHMIAAHLSVWLVWSLANAVSGLRR